MKNMYQLMLMVGFAVLASPSSANTLMIDPEAGYTLSDPTITIDGIVYYRTADRTPTFKADLGNSPIEFGFYDDGEVQEVEIDRYGDEVDFTRWIEVVDSTIDDLEYTLFGDPTIYDVSSTSNLFSALTTSNFKDADYQYSKTSVDFDILYDLLGVRAEQINTMTLEVYIYWYYEEITYINGSFDDHLDWFVEAPVIINFAAPVAAVPLPAPAGFLLAGLVALGFFGSRRGITS